MKKILALFVALLFAVISMASINLNTADEAALMEIKGIGKVTAHNIVEEREINGYFKDFKDVDKRVKGVGKKTIEKLKAEGAIISDDE